MTFTGCFSPKLYVCSRMQIIKEVGFDGSFKQFLEMLRTEKRFYYETKVSWNFFCSLLHHRRKLLCCLSEWVSEWVSECDNRIRAHHELYRLRSDFPQDRFSSEYFTEMLLSYIFRPSVVKYGILSSDRRSKLHAFIDCLLSNQVGEDRLLCKHYRREVTWLILSLSFLLGRIVEWL